MSARPLGLVRMESREVFVDMAGAEWPTHALAWRASVRGLLAAFLADQGVGPGVSADAVASALLEAFTVVPRCER